MQQSFNTNTKRSPSNYMNSWRLKNTLLNNEWVKGEIKKEIKVFPELNKNDNATQQNLWDTLNIVLRGKFIALSAYIKKRERKKKRERGQVWWCTLLIPALGR